MTREHILRQISDLNKKIHSLEDEDMRLNRSCYGRSDAYVRHIVTHQNSIRREIYSIRDRINDLSNQMNRI